MKAACNGMRSVTIESQDGVRASDKWDDGPDQHMHAKFGNSVSNERERVHTNEIRVIRP